MIVTITEYVAMEYRNRKTGSRYHAPFPAGVENDVNYGSGVKGLSYFLNNYCNVSIDKTYYNYGKSGEDYCDVLWVIETGKLKWQSAYRTITSAFE